MEEETPTEVEDAGEDDEEESIEAEVKDEETSGMRGFTVDKKAE